MDKLNLQTPDLTTENVKRIQQLFPSCVTESEDGEGNKIYKVDFDLLRAELGDESITEGLEERYRLDWPGKKRSILKANTPINKTLRPVKKDSVDWDNTGNLYIEGDNFEVLKALQESYLGEIKMIYIDPPYNTGNDFVYNDNFAEDSEDYKERTEQNDEGYKMIKNMESNGRFHSDWLSMMYERLRIAKDLLTNDGVIFISIDDNEDTNLKKICEEIFGYDFVDEMVWRKSGVGRDGKMKNTSTFRKDHEYIIVCFKNNQILNKSFEKPEWENEYGNPDNDPRGGYKAGSISKKEEASNPNHPNYYSVTSPSGKIFTRQFEIPKEEFDRLNDDNRIFWGKNLDAVPSIKIFQNEKRSVTTSSYIIEKDGYFSDTTVEGHSLTTTRGSKELEELLGVEGLGGEMRPKPTDLLYKLIQIGTNPTDIVLDFFSGSATTAHACMQLNAEDGGERKFIMVQLPESSDDKSIAYKAGYKTICDMGKERIRRAAKKIKEETGADIDYGFRVYRVDDSCLKEVDNHPSEIRQEDLFNNISNIKEDRTPEDLLTQVILSLGLTLDLPIEEKTIKNNKVFYVAGNSLVACFDENVDFGIVEEIAKDQPLKLVFRDASFRTDADRINVENTMKRLSENTIVKVI